MLSLRNNGTNLNCCSLIDHFGDTVANDLVRKRSVPWSNEATVHHTTAATLMKMYRTFFVCMYVYTVHCANEWETNHRCNRNPFIRYILVREEIDFFQKPANHKGCACKFLFHFYLIHLNDACHYYDAECCLNCSQIQLTRMLIKTIGMSSEKIPPKNHIRNKKFFRPFF